MENVVPYFNLETATGISLYVKYYIDEYRDDPSKKTIVLEKLRIVFSKESEYKKKVLAVNDFVAIFREKVRKKRLEYLKMFLMEIDPARYGEVNFSLWK